MDCWADGIHFRVRLEQARLCCLVAVGVRADGTKELVAIADGERGVHRQLGGAAARPTAPWDAGVGGWPSATAPLGCGRRSVTCPRRPDTSATGSRKLANVLGCLPKAVQAGARRALAEIR